MTTIEDFIKLFEQFQELDKEQREFTKRKQNIQINYDVNSDTLTTTAKLIPKNYESLKKEININLRTQFRIQLFSKHLPNDENLYLSAHIYTEYMQFLSIISDGQLFNHEDEADLKSKFRKIDKFISLETRLEALKQKIDQGGISSLNDDDLALMYSEQNIQNQSTELMNLKNSLPFELQIQLHDEHPILLRRNFDSTTIIQSNDYKILKNYLIAFINYKKQNSKNQIEYIKK